MYKFFNENQNNYFPSLTNLVQKIYKNFEIENTEFLNQNIKDKIFNYFGIKNIKKNTKIFDITNDNTEKKNLIESIDNNIIDKSFQTNISDNNKINNEIYNENELLISTNDENIINDEDNIQEKIHKNNEFNFHDFIKDFCDLGRLFWDSSFNFENEENFNYYLDYDI